MTKTRKKPVRAEPEVHDLSKLRGALKAIGGSMSDDWNNIVANQTIKTIWHRANADAEEIRLQRHATVDALIGIKPQDELEGMIAAQLVACHNASMECYRRAMHREQTFDGRKEELSQANKLSRTYSTLLEGLNRHRGKGAQKVTVEHVHVHSGGQAIVGSVEAPGGGFTTKSKDQPHALAYAPGATMRSADTTREPVPVASDAERPLSDARGNVTGRTEGE
jgi:hypothetical protein